MKNILRSSNKRKQSIASTTSAHGRRSNLSVFSTAGLRDKKLDSLVRNLFRPSYGGNRNFTLMYSLGHYLVSADDDMRPHALIETHPESLHTDVFSRGNLMKVGNNVFVEKSFDMLASLKDVLGAQGE